MTHARQRDFLDRCRAAGDALALATVFETAGSTYSKAGARMLIDGEGRFQGMLSGGCLEGDLAMRARVAIESGDVQFANYDLTAGVDDLWGMGVGCDGMMQVMLQPLGPANGYEPAASLLAFEAGRVPVTVVTVLESTVPAVGVGTTLVRAGEAVGGHHAPALAAALTASTDDIPAGQAGVVELAGPAGALRVLIDHRLPRPRLLVLGAGLDAEPVLRFAAELGWHCTVSDHRPAYVEANDFAGATRHCVPANEVAARLDLRDFDLAVVMSHHLASDREYLRQLAATGIPYVGLLGPPGRRDRLLAELGDAGRGLAGRLSGPAGLELGGRGPAAIALSIVAEMQQHLARRDGTG